MKTIADFDDEKRLRRFITKKLYQAYLEGKIEQLPVLSKIRLKDGKNAMDADGTKYLIADEDELIPVRV